MCRKTFKSNYFFNIFQEFISIKIPISLTNFPYLPNILQFGILQPKISNLK